MRLTKQRRIQDFKDVYFVVNILRLWQLFLFQWLYRTSAAEQAWLNIYLSLLMDIKTRRQLGSKRTVVRTTWFFELLKHFVRK